MPPGPFTEYALQEVRQVTLDANGEGWIVSIGPAQYGEEWLIEATQTTVTPAPAIALPAETRLRIFRNGTTELVEGTYSANQDNSNTAFKLRSGESLYYQYTNGDPGAVGIITITGVRRVSGRRGY